MKGKKIGNVYQLEGRIESNQAAIVYKGANKSTHLWR